MSVLDPDRYLTTSAGRVAYGAIGTGPDVVLVHGTPARSVIWSETARALSTRYRLHFLDLPGYGRSDKAEGQDVRLRSLAAALAKWLAVCGLDRPAMIGHDFGAAAVLGAHLMHGTASRGIAICDGVVLSPLGTRFSRHVRDHADVFAAVPAYIHDAILCTHLATGVHKPLAPAMMDCLLTPWRGPDGQAAFYRQVAQYDYDDTTRLEAVFGRIACPVTAIWGEHDAWVPPAEGARFARKVAGAQLSLIRGAGHFTMLDAPAELAEQLETWLDTLPL